MTVHTGSSNAIDVTVVSESGLTQEITLGRFRIRADEPVEVGGGGTGPSPYELLLASLGACKSMTVRLYSARKGWSLERITVRLRHYRVHSQDCVDCETKPVFVDRIDCEIELAGDLSVDQKARLHTIAEKCPVHRTLTSRIEIRTSIL